MDKREDKIICSSHFPPENIYFVVYLLLIASENSYLNNGIETFTPAQLRNHITLLVRAFFVIELCESIKALKVQIANFELYSSSPKEFRSEEKLVIWID